MKSRTITEVLDVESSPFAAEDYVQMACQLRRSAEMRVRYPDGKSGGIVINKGDLWHAWDNLGSGDEAFLRMVGVARVTHIRSLALNGLQTQTISQSCQKLILQALISHDSAATNPDANTRTAASSLYTSDSEPTRPNWPALRSRTSANHDTSDRDITPPRESDAGPSARQTERPVAVDAFSAKPRSITTFLRQPHVLQRASVGLLGIILAGSVGRIVASPAGGEPDDATTRDIRTPTSLKHEATQAAAFSPASKTSAHAPVDVVNSRSSDIVQVSSLPEATPNPPSNVVTRVRLVSSSGLNHDVVTRGLSSALNDFTACYEHTKERAPKLTEPSDVSVVVRLNEHGSVSNVTTSGGPWLSLNSCVAELSERLTSSWATSAPSAQPSFGGAGTRPSRVEWTVSYTPQPAPTQRSEKAIVHSANGSPR